MRAFFQKRQFQASSTFLLARERFQTEFSKLSGLAPQFKHVITSYMEFSWGKFFYDAGIWMSVGCHNRSHQLQIGSQLGTKREFVNIPLISRIESSNLCQMLTVVAVRLV